MNKKVMWLVVVAAFVSVVFALRIYLFVPARQFHSLQLLPKPEAVIAFSLAKNGGEEFTANNFNDRWSLIFFGFTNCPDFCPLELQKLGNLLRMLGRSEQIPLQVIFISLDPERDTADKISTYTAFFHSQIQGVRGSNAELARVAHFFGSDYSRNAVKNGKSLSIPSGIDMPAGVDDNYQLDHSARIYVVSPQSAYIGSFAPPHNTEQMWEDLQLIFGK